MAVLVILASVSLAACARTGLDREPPPPGIRGLPLPDVIDVAPDAPDVPDVPDVVDVQDEPEVDVPRVCPDFEVAETGCLEDDVFEREAGLCNGLDDDCDGEIDEGCLCGLGEVQSCFNGPPARANVGACQRGTQRCLATGGWGACSGGVDPSEERCDALDNDCDGCVDEFVDCTLLGSCPTPNDPRTPDGAPFEPYALNGADFYQGPASSWTWRVEGGICDQLGATVVPSFDLANANSATATFTPRLSGAYTISMQAQTPSGPFACSWVVDVGGPGLRVEMCYPESSDSDIDLYMMRAAGEQPWFFPVVFDPGERRYAANEEACAWHNCEAALRGSPTRADWGYENSDISACNRGPQGDQWEALGFCANPRLDIDNNLQEGIGLPENINVDRPNDGDRFRVMVQNWTGSLAHPVINVYCAGRLSATFGAPPDQLTNFQWRGIAGDPNAMWRAADIEMQVNDAGDTIGCTVTNPPRPDGEPGYDVTFNEARY